jgi:hypothetical protein
MLRITIPATTSEYWDSEKNQFVYETITKEQTLTLEHSLVSISKWESKWHKPFLSATVPKTDEETIDYIRCMTLTQNVEQDVYKYITNNNIVDVEKYIDDSMTAVTNTLKESKTSSREVITSETIYYWMIKLGIPFECQKWHLNRLIALIRVCNEKESKNNKTGKNGKSKKAKQKELARKYSEINAMRRKQLNSKG